MMSDTTLSWFPMRATYSRELVVKKELDRLGVENFLPMKDKWVENGMSEELRQVPAVHNLIFVHSTKERITELKHSYKQLEPLRYMTKPSLSGDTNVIMQISDSKMSSFMRLASYNYDKRIVFFENLQFVSKPGPEVEIIDGDFMGVRGVIKRIRGIRCVAVSIEDVAAVGIMDLPNKYLRYIGVGKGNVRN